MHHGDSFRTLSASETPKLVKALGHLTTPVSTLRFNHDAQLLAMASKDKKDAMRLVSSLFLDFLAFRSFTLRPFASTRYDLFFANLRLASGKN